MAEAPKEGGKKKGKMPMMIALVVMLVAGGFFGMKMGSGGKKVEPKTELGEVVSLGEFLVNLSDGRTFLKTDISVHVAKNGHLDESKGGGEHGAKVEAPAAVRDAVVAVLSSQSLDSVNSPEGKLALKKAIAKAINAVAPHEKEEGEKSEKKHKKKGDDEEEEIIDPSWDSQTGPVLKVYFTTFATQQ